MENGTKLCDDILMNDKHFQWKASIFFRDKINYNFDKNIYLCHYA